MHSPRHKETSCYYKRQPGMKIFTTELTRCYFSSSLFLRRNPRLNRDNETRPFKRLRQNIPREKNPQLNPFPQSSSLIYRHTVLPSVTVCGTKLSHMCCGGRVHSLYKRLNCTGLSGIFLTNIFIKYQRSYSHSFSAALNFKIQQRLYIPAPSVADYNNFIFRFIRS